MSTTERDYYELLGIERGADATTIKRAFRKRARELHPDVNPDNPKAEEEFRNVTEAYEVLSDDERRSIYDRYGKDGLNQSKWQPQYASFGNISDIFSAFFGDDMFSQMAGGAGATGPARGDSIVASVALSFQESAIGTTREIEYDAVSPCSTCAGSGADGGEAGLEHCEACNGIGVVRSVSQSIFGQVIRESACGSCNGRGRIIVTPCTACAGSGEQTNRHTITVDIPGGIADGQRIRLSGRGHAGPMGGPPGNLYVDISVAADERFLREGDDLITAVDLTVTEAMLGCTKSIDMVDDTEQEVAFEAGIQPGEILTVRGQGMGRLRGGDGRGNLRIVVNVQIPRDLSGEQRDIVNSLQDSESEKNYSRHEGLLSKLKRVIRTHG